MKTHYHNRMAILIYVRHQNKQMWFSYSHSLRKLDIGINAYYVIDNPKEPYGRIKSVLTIENKELILW